MGTFCPHYLIVVLCHHTEKEGDGRESVGEGERESEADADSDPDTDTGSDRLQELQPHPSLRTPSLSSTIPLFALRLFSLHHCVLPPFTFLCGKNDFDFTHT